MMDVNILNDANLRMFAWFLDIQSQRDPSYSTPLMILKAIYVISQDEFSASISKDGCQGQSCDFVGRTDIAVDNFAQLYAKETINESFKETEEFEYVVERAPAARMRDGSYTKESTHFFVVGETRWDMESILCIGRDMAGRIPGIEIDVSSALYEMEGDDVLPSQTNESTLGSSVFLYTLGSLSKVYDLPFGKSARVLENPATHALVYETSCCLDDFLDKYHGKAEGLSVLVGDVHKMLAR